MNRLEHDCSLILYSNMIKKASDELLKQREFLLAAAENPRLLFEKHLISLDVQSVAARLMNSAYIRDKKVKVHDFQSYLASLVNQYVQEWLREQDIRGHLIHAAVRKPNTYPSIMAIYCDNKELIQFDIHERFYGIQHESKEEASIRADYSTVEAQINEQIQIDRDEITRLEKMLTEPFSLVYSHYHEVDKKRQWKSYFTELYEYVNVLWMYKLRKRKAEEIKGKVLREIEDRYNSIQQTQKHPLGWLPLDEYLEKNRQNKEMIAKLIPLFESFGFTRTYERNKLY